MESSRSAPIDASRSVPVTPSQFIRLRRFKEITIFVFIMSGIINTGLAFIVLCGWFTGSVPSTVPVLKAVEIGRTEYSFFTDIFLTAFFTGVFNLIPQYFGVKKEVVQGKLPLVDDRQLHRGCWRVMACCQSWPITQCLMQCVFITLVGAFLWLTTAYVLAGCSGNDECTLPSGVAITLKVLLASAAASASMYFALPLGSARLYFLSTHGASLLSKDGAAQPLAGSPTELVDSASDHR